MGNTDSVPVVSQVKSLVQAIAGDMEGAKKTQEQFLRTGLVASQVNSAVVAIQGDHAEARKIQEEFGEETVLILEGTPIIGHAMSAGYAAGGDLDKAEQVKLELSKLAIRICFPGGPDSNQVNSGGRFCVGLSCLRTWSSCLCGCPWICCGCWNQRCLGRR